jgi:hypothetical protein
MIKNTIETPVVAKIVAADEAMDQRFFSENRKAQQVYAEFDDKIRAIMKECKVYADKLNSEMFKNFQVPGIVNN